MWLGDYCTYCWLYDPDILVWFYIVTTCMKMTPDMKISQDRKMTLDMQLIQDMKMIQYRERRGR